MIHPDTDRDAAVRTSPGRLVLVTGSGRSGTSTVAGALQRLGLYVPQPEVPADETNPRGFYESQWVVDLHKELLDRVPARTNDARPAAANLVRKATAGGDVQRRVTDWLGDQLAAVGPGAQLVVKDPRTLWFVHLWSRAAADHGVELSFLTMLRHPVEVSRSRDIHYLADRTEEFRVLRQTANIASWVNGAVETERVTHGHPRAFVRYVDLLADWRVAMERARVQIGVDYHVPAADDHHTVDDFIDVKLNRSQVSWEDFSTHAELEELAIASWDAVGGLVDEPSDEESVARLQDVGERYATLHGHAEAIALDHTNVSVQVSRRKLRAKLERESRTGAAASLGATEPLALRGVVRRGLARLRR